MKEEFKNRLLKYIKENTGYLEEFKVVNIFSKAGWDVRHSIYYLDRDEEKGREIDLLASKNFIFKYGLGEEARITINLICEVKKSIDKPWIIFSAKKNYYIGSFLFSLYYENNMKNILDKKTKVGFGRNSSISNFARIGETYCEAFMGSPSKRSSDSSQIFRSLASSAKASEYFLSMRKKNSLADLLYSKSVEFYEPIVIFDGIMCEAYLNKQDILELNEINHIPILFNRISPSYNRDNYIIDVITIKELPNLLTNKEKWVNTIIKNIQE